MKISWIADLHLNKTSYQDEESPLSLSLPFRCQDFMNSLEYMVSLNIEKIKPNLVVFLGDIYDSYDPTPAITGFFSQQLRRLASAKIPVIIIVGNHDICSKYHALNPLMKLEIPNIKVYDSPANIMLGDSFFMLFPASIAFNLKTKEI